MVETFTVEKDGKEITYRTLLTFYNKEAGKHFVVYTDDSKDEKGNVKVLVSSYDPDVEKSPLCSIESPEEWKIVSDALDVHQAELMAAIDRSQAAETVEIEEKSAPARFEMNGLTYQVLASLVDEENNNEYVLYVPAQTEAEKVEVLVGRLLEKDENGVPSKVGPIETEEEWRLIEEPVGVIIEHLNQK